MTQKQTQQEFWKEDADRINAISANAKKVGLIDVDEGAPPKLNPDGSLKEVSEETEEGK